MPKYKIVVLVSKTELIEVEAENESKAMDLAEDTVAESYNHNEWFIEADPESSANLNDNWGEGDDNEN